MRLDDNHADEDLGDIDDGWVGKIRAPGALRLIDDLDNGWR